MGRVSRQVRTARRAAAQKSGANLPAIQGAPATKALSIIDGAGMSGDSTVSSVLAASGSGNRVRDLEMYHFLATKHPYVNGCITLIADTISAEGFDVVPTDVEDARPLADDDDPRVAEIHQFMRLAFPQSSFRQWRRAASIDLNSYGISLLRKKRTSTGIEALERLDPRCVTAKLSADRTKIDSYLVRPLQINGYVNTPFTVEVIKGEDVILFAAAGGDPVSGFPSPLEALDLTLAVDISARKFRAKFFDNGGTPSMVVTMPGAGEDQYKKVANSLRKEKTSVDNAYKVWLLAGDDIQVTALSSAGKNDGDFMKLAALNREDVCSVYKVPVGMLTYTANSLGSSGKGDDRMFFEQFAVLPQEEQIYETLTINLLRDEFEIDDLALAPKRRGRIRTDLFEAASTAVKFGATGNEARRLVNLPAITDPKFDMDAPLFIGASKLGVVADEPLEGATADPAPGTQPGSGNAKPAADAATDRHDDEVAKKAASRFLRRGY